jgi:hypothetical protein
VVRGQPFDNLFHRRAVLRQELQHHLRVNRFQQGRIIRVDVDLVAGPQPELNAARNGANIDNHGSAAATRGAVIAGTRGT